MAPIVRPGVMFKVIEKNDLPKTGLHRTASMYSYGETLELSPKCGDIYVMCKDKSIQSVFNPETPIGWALNEDANNNFTYRVTQVGHEPKECLVDWAGMMEDVPEGTGHIGSELHMCCALCADSQDAEITEQMDNGEDEVNSM